MNRYFDFPLLMVECLLCLVLFHRRYRDYPLTCCTMLFVAGLYAMLLTTFYTEGTYAYIGGHIAMTPFFRAAAAILCAESVMLMAQGIPQVRWFAAASSLVFAGVTGCALLIADRIVPGTGHTRWGVLWSMACVVYLAANHWLYSRGGPLNPLAGRHAIGAMVMMFATASALGLSEWSGGRGGWAVIGHVVGRVGPLVAISVWMRRDR